MSFRVGTIIAWICSGLVALFNVFAGIMKFMPVAPGSEAALFMERLGISSSMQQALGVLELSIVVLYLVPRTSTVGFVLLIGYLAGALATNLTHGFTHLDALPIYMSFVLMMVAAWYRNPELIARLLGRPMASKA